MVERSFFWTTSGSGDNTPIDREQWWQVFRTLLGAYKQTNSGGVVFGTGTGGNVLLVEANAVPDANVKVNIGLAFVDGTAYEVHTAAEQVLIDPNNDAGMDDRIDTIILRKTFLSQTVRLIALQGTPAPVPVPPTLTQNATVWEFPLADVAADYLFTSIVAGDITDRRVPAQLRAANEGGTGINNYAIGDMIMASAVDVFEKIAAPANDPAWLIYNSAKTPPARMIPMRKAIIIGSSSTALGTSAAGTVLELGSVQQDPDSLITSLASNQFVLAAGAYLISTSQNINNTAGVSRTMIAWIHNATQTSVEIQGPPGFTSITQGIPYSIPPQIVIADGIDAFELRGFAGGASVIDLGVLSLTPTPTGSYTSSFRNIFIQRLQD